MSANPTLFVRLTAPCDISATSGQPFELTMHQAVALQHEVNKALRVFSRPFREQLLKECREADAPASPATPAAKPAPKSKEAPSE